MSFVSMKCMRGSKIHAFKIREDHFFGILKDPTLLADYWGEFLKYEKGEVEKPQTSQTTRKRSKSVGDVPRRKSISNDEERSITDGTVHQGRKKGKQKECGNKRRKSVSPKSKQGMPADLEPEQEPTSEGNIKELADSLDLPAKGTKRKTSKKANKAEGNKKRRSVSPKSTLGKQIDLEPEQEPTSEENIQELADSHSLDSPVKGTKGKTCKQANKSEGNKKRRSVSPKSTLGKQIDLEPEQEPTSEETIQELADSHSLDSPVKGTKGKTCKQANKSEGDKKDRKLLTSPKSVCNEEPSNAENAPVCEGNPDEAPNDESSEDELPIKDKTTSKQSIKYYSKGILRDTPAHLRSTPKQRGRKRKLGVTSEENQATPEQLVEDEHSTTVSEDSGNIMPCSPSEQPNEGNVQENSSSPNVVCRKSARQQQRRQRKNDAAKGVAFSPNEQALSPQAAQLRNASKNVKGETRVSDFSKSMEGSPENHFEMNSESSPPSVGSPKPHISQNIKLAPVKTIGSTSHFEMDSESSPQNIKLSPVKTIGTTSHFEMDSESSPPSVSSPKPHIPQNIKHSSVKTIGSTSHFEIDPESSPPSVGSPTPHIPQNIKLSPVKTIGSTSQIVPVVCAQESSVIPTKLILRAPLPQGCTVTPVQTQNLRPVCASAKYVTILPTNLPTPTSAVSKPLAASNAVPLSTIAQVVAQQTLQQHVTQNVSLTSSPHSSLPLTSVVITPARSAVSPKVVSQNTSPKPSLQNITQTAPFNNCQPVQHVQTPGATQSSPQASPVNVKQTTVGKYWAPVSSLGKQPMLHAAEVVKKSLQQNSISVSLSQGKGSCDLKTSPQKTLQVELGLTTTASQNISSVSTSTLRSSTQDSGITITAIPSVQKRGHPPSSLKQSFANQTQIVRQMQASRRMLFCGVPKGGQSDSSKVESELKSTQGPKLNPTEGALRGAAFGPATQKTKLLGGPSGAKALQGKSGSRLTISGTQVLSLETMKALVQKKIMPESESTGDKLKSCENVMRKGKSAAGVIKDPAVSNVSVLLVPVSVPHVPSDKLGSASQENIIQSVAGLKSQKLICSKSSAKKRSFPDAEGHCLEPKSGKYIKVSTTKGKTDMSLQKSQSVSAMALSAASEEEEMQPNLNFGMGDISLSAESPPVGSSETSKYKIIHLSTPVQPPIINRVAKDVSSVDMPSRTLNDDFVSTSPKKVPKTTKSAKSTLPRVSHAQPKINLIASTVRGTHLNSPHNVPDVSSNPSLPYNVVKSVSPSPGVSVASPVVSELTPEAGSGQMTELQCSTVSSPDLKAFETLLNEGLDSITQLLAEKAIACKGSWDKNICFSFLSLCLKEKDTFFNPSVKDLNFETICCAINKTFPELSASIGECKERWWEFVTLYEILLKKLECHRMKECLLIPEEGHKVITMICQAMAYRKYPLSHKKWQEGNRNSRVGAALKFLNDSLEGGMDKASACSRKAISPNSVHQTLGSKQSSFLDLFMLLAIKIQQFTQSTEFFADCIEETLAALAEDCSAS